MIEQKSTGRTRPFTFPEVVRAVGRAMTRPDADLTAPVIRPLQPAVSASMPCVELELRDHELSSFIAWSRALSSVSSIVLLPLIQPLPLVCLRMTGTFPRTASRAHGPRVSVLTTLDTLPAAERRSVRALSLAELYTLGDTTVSHGVDALVGAR